MKHYILKQKTFNGQYLVIYNFMLTDKENIEKVHHQQKAQKA